MKFRHGAWLWHDGITPHLMARVAEHRIEDDALWLAAVDRAGTSGADTFEGTVLTLRVTSPMSDVIRVQVQHHAPPPAGPHRFDLDYSLSAPGVRIEDQSDYLLFTSGRLSLRIAKGPPWEMQFIDETGAPVTGGDAQSLGYMRVDGATPRVMQRLSMGVGECVYGLGERFGPLVKNGQAVTIWNEDAGTISDESYKNVPFYLTSRGYGVLVNSPGKVEFEVGTEIVSQVQFSAPGEALDYYLFHGPAPKDVLEKYARLCGRPALPPAWSLGLWLSTSFTTTYDERTVSEFVDGMQQRGIPLSVLHFDCFWMKQRHWCDFEWDRTKFADPRGMLERLHARGLRVCVWINPYVSQMSKLFDEGRAHGYFIKRRDGSVYQADQWQPGMAYVDFTNPLAVEWYRSKLRELLETGVDCFKTDFGERIPSDDDVVYHDGSDPKLMHNYYAYLYNKAVFELLESVRGAGEALVFARAGTAGSQKFPVHWGGDCAATFESMAEELRGGLSFCTSGAAFWSHDIGGFTGTADAALYKRWVAFGLLSTHSRLHGSSSYRVPWLFDEESVQVMRFFARLKNRLFPYLYAASRDAHERGWPVMRTMLLEFPDDPACRYLDRQYMLGSSLLVAPVFRADHVAEHYVPPGRWTDLLTNRVIDGGSWRSETLDFMHVPLLVRENTVLPTCASEEHPSWRLSDPLTLHVFHVRDGADFSARAAAGDGGGVATFRCRRAGERLTIEPDGKARNVNLLLRATRAAGKITNGRAAREVPEGLLVEWRDPAASISVVLDE